MKTEKHKINENILIVTDRPSAAKIRILRSNDGRFYNKVLKKFEVFSQAQAANYDFLLQELTGGIKKITVSFLPSIPLDVIVQFLTNDIVPLVLGNERHVFGGYQESLAQKLCVLYGTVIDLSGNAMSNVKVEANLNKSGYFIDRHAAIGPSVLALTNNEGYFEMALLQGANVTVTIPSTGFVCSGFVPKTSVLELSPMCLC